MKKAMFIDLDGTLLTEDQKISKLNKDAVKEAISDGWDIILSTGKSLANARKHYDNLKLDTWLITSQGQLILKPKTGEIIENFMSDESVKELIAEGKPKYFVIETMHGVYSKNKEDIRIAKFLDCVPMSYTNQKLKGIIGLYIIADNSYFYEHNKFDIFKWDTAAGYKVLSFKPKGINKTFALETVRAKEKYETIIVLGNGRSDLKSLKMANLGIAMINSQRRVLAEVPIKSEKDNNNSGVGIEIRKILNGEYKF